ncbi:ABC transporter ATP-binding protein [Clostridium sardiniense]|uniref:ABC transporter ATP-binding protein n=1 Tax=Clostridium sardiniense TaxID=29369 RepID=UPI00195D9B67|nr:ABC transporter ATP-binding protein [Clostridium sardiniense]MBM7835693.1 iron complex transport system ATP-binding protein [Clostridium sardiniense]
MKLEIKNLNYNIKKLPFLSNINLNVKKGQFVGLIGPNGCGKTTLLKNIYRTLEPEKGSILIDDKNIKGLKNKEFSKLIAVVMQENHLEFDFTVKEIVSMGRLSSTSKFSSDISYEDEKIIDQCLEKVELIKHKDSSFFSLSGGEKQRVMIALALCQDTDFIVLDEPTNHLDIKNQIQIMNMLKDSNITIFTTIHDMNIAAAFCDYIYIVKGGKIVGEGTVEEVFTKEMFKEIFEVDTYIYVNPHSNKLNVSYLL